MLYLWIAVLVICIVIEIATTALVSIWFAAAAVIAIAAYALGLGTVWQIIIFTVSSIVGMFLFTKVYRKNIHPSHVPTNLDRYVGETTIVSETIDNINSKGQVKIHGEIWNARSIENSEIIKAGTVVTIVQFEGAKVLVKK